MPDGLGQTVLGSAWPWTSIIPRAPGMVVQQPCLPWSDCKDPPSLPQQSVGCAGGAQQDCAGKAGWGKQFCGHVKLPACPQINIATKGLLRNSLCSFNKKTFTVRSHNQPHLRHRLLFYVSAKANYFQQTSS